MSAIATPATDHYFDSLPEADTAALAALDERYLSEEKARVASWVADKLTAPTHSVRRRLELWERLGTRIQESWPPDGTYLVDEYVNDLDTRDSLEEIATALTGPIGERFRGLLDRLDEAFRQATIEDQGTSIAWRLNESKVDLALHAWWWHRAPNQAPWA